MMTGLLTIATSLLLASASGTTERLDETQVKVSTTVDASDPMKMFETGEKQLKKLARAACGDQGKPIIQGEPMVEAISITPEGQQQATLAATYKCSAKG